MRRYQETRLRPAEYPGDTLFARLNPLAETSADYIGAVPGAPATWRIAGLTSQPSTCSTIGGWPGGGPVNGLSRRVSLTSAGPVRPGTHRELRRCHRIRHPITCMSAAGDLAEVRALLAPGNGHSSSRWPAAEFRGFRSLGARPQPRHAGRAAAPIRGPGLIKNNRFSRGP